MMIRGFINKFQEFYDEKEMPVAISLDGHRCLIKEFDLQIEDNKIVMVNLRLERLLSNGELNDYAPIVLFEG